MMLKPSAAKHEEGEVLSATMGDLNSCEECDKQYFCEQTKDKRVFSEALQSQNSEKSGTSTAEEKQMDSES